MSANALDILTGGTSGGILVTGTDEVVLDAYMIQTNEATEIEAIEVDGEDVTEARNLDGETIAAGVKIYAGRAYGTGVAPPKITAITLTSGSVIAY